jgi:hypothetical protein
MAERPEGCLIHENNENTWIRYSDEMMQLKAKCETEQYSPSKMPEPEGQQAIPPGVIVKKCTHCDKEFFTDRNNKKYCSDSCGASARSKRSKNKKTLNSLPETTRTIKNYG